MLAMATLLSGVVQGDSGELYRRPEDWREHG
jgi:hypothetical protein